MENTVYFNFLGLFTTGVLGVFLISFWVDRKSIFTGFMLNGLILTLIGDVIVLGIISNNAVFRIIALILVFLCIFSISFGIIFLVIGLFLNARHVKEKEGTSFSNRLTFFAAIAILFMLLGLPFISSWIPESWVWLHIIIQLIIVTVTYFCFVFLNFLTSVLIYQWISPRKNKDFIIVLGSGLRNGVDVTPLLASRIEAAITFYKKQKKKGKVATLIFSGGQGPDELISEGQAMLEYALKQGIPEEDCIAETRSTTTLENLLFSKEIMDERFPNGKYKCAVSSNNFHVFRAAHIAKSIHIEAQGIGAPTALYFLPNALIREFIGFIVLKPTIHIIILSVLYILNIANTLIVHFS